MMQSNSSPRRFKQFKFYILIFETAGVVPSFETGSISVHTGHSERLKGAAGDESLPRTLNQVLVGKQSLKKKSSQRAHTSALQKTFLKFNHLFLVSLLNYPENEFCE